MNILALKLVSGEDLIGDVTITDTDYIIENPVRLMMVPGQSSASQPSFGFAPYPVYMMESNNLKLTISKTHVIFNVEPDKEFVNQYNSIFGTGIITPSSNLILK